LRMQAILTEDDQERADLIRQADEVRNLALTLQASDVSRVSPAPSVLDQPTADFQAAVDRLKPVRIGGTIKAPKKTRDVRPVYPADALAAGVQGIVVLETLIDADGKVVDARVLRSVPMLEAAALHAVRQWQFSPTTIDGAPTAVLMTVTINFGLQQ
jgi:TonB family protein